jgi:hypothetical protein
MLNQQLENEQIRLDCGINNLGYGVDSLKLDPPNGFDEAMPTPRSILLIPVSAFCIERRP